MKKIFFAAVIGLLGFGTITSSVAQGVVFSLDDPNITYKSAEGKVLTKAEIAEIMAKIFSMQTTDLGNGKKEVTLRVMTEADKKESVIEKDSYINQWKNKPMPAFEFKDRNGKSLSAAQLRGKVVVMNFWFAGCKPCVAEMPELNKLVEKYTGEDVVFIAPANDKAAVIETFLKKRPFNYAIVPDALKYAKETMQIVIYPTHLIINSDGTILDVIIGGSEHIGAELDKAITLALTTSKK